MADRLMLIVPENADSMVSILDRYMKEWVSELSCIISFILKLVAIQCGLICKVLVSPFLIIK